MHLSADGHLVVHHDRVVAGGSQKMAISSMTLAELREYQVGGEAIPTLADVIARVGRRLRIYCELKGPGTAESAVSALAPLGEAAAVHSFDHRLIAAARLAAPDVPRGVLESSYHIDACFPLRAVAGRDLWQHEASIDSALVAKVHACGGRVIAWTVNDADRAIELAALGVDGVCTDDVAALAARYRQLPT